MAKLKRPKNGKSKWQTLLSNERVQRHALMPLACATLLLMAGIFFAWQTQLVSRENEGLAQTEHVRQSQIQTLGQLITKATQEIQAALDNPDIRQALVSGDAAGRVTARTILKAAAPEVKDAEFFSSTLNEVLTGDLAALGYAKASMLLRAQATSLPAPAQMHNVRGEGSRLALALPVIADKKTLAYVYVHLPFSPILSAFHKGKLVGARLDLRQGDGRGDLVIASIGDSGSSSVGDVGEPITGSILRIGIAAPDYFIVFTRNLWILLPLTLLCLISGLFTLWIRQVGLSRVLSVLWRRAPIAQEEEIIFQPHTTSPDLSGNIAKSKAPTTVLPAEPVNIDRNIFRAYDIRGVIGKTLTAGVARVLGQAIGSEAIARGLKEIVVGRDGRLSGPELAGALIEGLRSTGCDVFDIGAAPTPLVYFAAYHLNTGSGVSVTGSHNPPDYNGFKIVLGGETLAEGAIQDLYARISEKRFTNGSGNLQIVEIAADYIDRITSDVQMEKKLKVVVDCGNGIPGVIVPAVLEGIGCEVMPLYCDVDGTFPNHHPDPSDVENLQDLIAMVKKWDADLGLAFDGDGDRLGVVTKTGEVIFPDRLLMLFAMDVLTRNPGAMIIYDVKCTGHLQSLILSHGGSPMMWKTGHSLIKAKMRETDALLAGEMSGHFFFKERWYGFDDGIYAAARLMEILAGDLEGRDPQAIFDTLPKGVSTPELKIPMQEGEHYRFMETFKQKASFEGARITTIDGIRADWPDGWGLVRASNTTPVLVLRFDAENETALKRIQEQFRAQLKAIDPALKLPF